MIKINKAIFDSRLAKILKDLAWNKKPKEQYAWLLGKHDSNNAYIYDLIYDSQAVQTNTRVEPNADYFIKSYKQKQRLLPDTRLRILSWFHTHPINYPSEIDIKSQEDFRKIYQPSFMTFINYNNLDMKCFDVINGKAIELPYEAVFIPDDKKRKS